MQNKTEMSQWTGSLKRDQVLLLRGMRWGDASKFVQDAIQEKLEREAAKKRKAK